MIELVERESVAVVKLAHGKANALDIALCEAIAEQFDTLRTSPVRAVVLTGQGRMFSAGVDLLKLTDGGADYVRRFLPALHRLYQTVFFFPKPVIAAINGHAIAGGCVLACCADRRIAARDRGRIGVTELLVGVPFPSLAFEVMRFATAPQLFADTVLRGATFSFETARERGLVDEIVDVDALFDQAVAGARSLAALSPKTFEQTKRQIRQPVADALDRHGARTDATAMTIWTGSDTLDQVRDYVARTLRKA